MSKKLQSIYECLCDYSQEAIDNVINELSIEDKMIIRDRYGDDLHNPIVTSNWTSEKRKTFYGKIMPKIKRMLKNNVPLNHDLANKDEKADIVLSSQFNSKSLTSIPIFDLISLLKENVTSEEICHRFNISKEQLYRELLNLRNCGVNYGRKYYSDGSIKYTALQNVKALKEKCSAFQSRDRIIITDAKENNIKLLLISDLHFGNSLERLDLVDKAFNYCIKNGINIILCGGDFIDGTYSKQEQRISNVFQQIDYFINNYPSDKNILTFGVAGDHDMSALNSYLVDIVEACNNYRHDIIIPGYNNALVHLKNDSIQMFHHIKGGELAVTASPIILHGHSHKYICQPRKDVLNITIPSLSNVGTNIPSALELEISFGKGYITSANTKQIYFGSEDIILNESKFSFIRDIKNENIPIENVEIYKSTFGKTLTNKNTNLSQIEKFQKKYGKLFK